MTQRQSSATPVVQEHSEALGRAKSELSHICRRKSLHSTLLLSVSDISAYCLHRHVLPALAEGIRVLQDTFTAIWMQKAHEGHHAHVAQGDEDGFQELPDNKCRFVRTPSKATPLKPYSHVGQHIEASHSNHHSHKNSLTRNTGTGTLAPRQQAHRGGTKRKRQAEQPQQRNTVPHHHARHSSSPCFAGSARRPRRIGRPP